MNQIAHSCAKNGLAQIPEDGLRRLIGYIDAGKPLCLSGDIIQSGEP